MVTLTDQTSPAATTGPLLEVRDLHVRFETSRGTVRAVEGISYTVNRGEIVAIVGESGCGKSVSSLAIMRLLAKTGRVTQGSITFDGRDLLALSAEEMREIRGRDISMIFQEPMTSLNPVMTIGRQIGEALTLHQGMSQKAALRRAVEMLQLVGIPEPAQRIKEYPHQLSGGMRQRAMIAMALACNPKVLIADEPTSALDVTIQAQILELINKLQREFGTALILITHDLGVVAETAERVIVMYAGRKVEEASVGDLFEHPMHPYTRGLMNSIPRLALMRREAGPAVERLQEIPGIVPALTNLPQACTFAPRCAFADDKCRGQFPPYEEKAPAHWAACWHSDRLTEAGDAR